MLSLEGRRTLVVWLFDQTMIEGKRKHLQKYLAKMPFELGLKTADGESETIPRWQAGYDLALGQTLATRARAQQYNAMLALLKRDAKFNRADSNTWVREPADEFISILIKKTARLATEHLQRVINEHPGTPWAFIAARELKRPMGWKWTETTTEVQAP